MAPRRCRIAARVVTAAVVLAACGDDDTESSTVDTVAETTSSTAGVEEGTSTTGATPEETTTTLPGGADQLIEVSVTGTTVEGGGRHPVAVGDTVAIVVTADAVVSRTQWWGDEGQSFVALLSDPLGSGRDVFDTAGNTIDFTVVTADQIAYVQVASIVVGHVAGVIVAHDKAVERYAHRRAVASQYPLLAVMIGYTVAGLLLLLNA